MLAATLCVMLLRNMLAGGGGMNGAGKTTDR